MNNLKFQKKMSETVSTAPKSAALRWGIINEDKARIAHEKVISLHHEEFRLSYSGLNVNVKASHLGTSPDGLIECKCCGKCLLAIKCPYSVCDKEPTKVSYLIQDSCEYKLDWNHQYYYQVQGQMGIMERSHTDFVCWTPNDVFIQRISFDEDFF